MADLNHRVTELENEIKVIKNEVKAILLDVREQYLNAENPFVAGPAMSQGGQFSAVVSCQTEAPSAKPVTPEEIKKPENSDTPPEVESTEEKSSDQEDHSENEKSQSQNDSKDKKGKKSTLPSLSMGPDSGDSKKSHTGKSLNKMKTALSRFAAEDDDSSSFSGAEPQLGKDSWNKTNKAMSSKSGKGNGNNINLLTIAALSRWVDESTEKIGKERAEVMVEACYLVGHISSDFKDLLIRLVRLSQAEEPKRGRINTQDYLGVIARLDGLLGYNDGSESALLSILTDNKEPHNG